MRPISLPYRISTKVPIKLASKEFIFTGFFAYKSLLE